MFGKAILAIGTFWCLLLFAEAHAYNALCSDNTGGLTYSLVWDEWLWHVGGVSHATDLNAFIRSLNCPGTASASTVDEKYRLLLSCNKVQNTASQIVPFVRATFNFLDRNGNGKFERSESEAAIAALHLPGEHEQRQKFGLCDSDNNGYLDRTEYARCSVISYGEIFARADRDHDGLLSKQQMIKLIKAFAKVVYTDATSEDQRAAIHKLRKDPMQYDLVDVVKVDTNLFENYLEKHRNQM